MERHICQLTAVVVAAAEQMLLGRAAAAAQLWQQESLFLWEGLQEEQVA
jgi:hypothetical protein